MANAVITSGLHMSVLKVALATAVVAGDVTLHNGRVLVATNDAGAGVENIYAHEAELEAPKAAVAVAAGDTAYWDDAAALFTNVAAGGIKCGMFTQAAVAASGAAQISFTNEVNL